MRSKRGIERLRSATITKFHKYAAQMELLKYIHTDILLNTFSPDFICVLKMNDNRTVLRVAVLFAVGVNDLAINF